MVVATVVAILAIYVVAMLILQAKSDNAPKIETPEFTQDDLVSQAKKIYSEKKFSGVDMSKGPCLTDNLVENWVLDVAHNPREEVDNLAENQCAAFRNGDAHHFIELDISGNFIRMK